MKRKTSGLQCILSEQSPKRGFQSDLELWLNTLEKRDKRQLWRLIETLPSLTPTHTCPIPTWIGHDCRFVTFTKTVGWSLRLPSGKCVGEGGSDVATRDTHSLFENQFEREAEYSNQIHSRPQSWHIFFFWISCFSTVCLALSFPHSLINSSVLKSDKPFEVMNLLRRLDLLHRISLSRVYLECHGSANEAFRFFFFNTGPFLVWILS